ncbi:glycosyltransferase [Rubritalea sp.]|uniref:glycosyltransferase family 2 protein n=1 Tax=Rubritalea sp. TaxID=2109375 RepID=UPI003EF72772
MSTLKKPTLSFIIPLKDEDQTIVELHSRISEQAKEHSRGWEIIFIDDGSDDNSWNVIQEIAKKDPEHVRALRFRTNRTKAPALATGYHEASGEIVFTLDADLQDDPKEIPRFLEKINEGEGWDIVSGYKEKRHDPWHKVLPSRVFNALLSKVNGVKLHDHNCGFKCYRQEVVKDLPMYGEMHRMVPSLASIEGYRTTEIVVEHHARQHGVSKYGVKRFLRGFLDMWSVFFVKNYRERPLHLMGGWAILCLMLAGFLWLLCFIPGLPAGLKTGLLATAPIAFFTAPILIVVGFLAELITNRHYANQTDVPIIERIDLPNSEVSSKVISMADETTPGMDTKPKILVADDDPITRSLSSRTLEAEGWNVQTTATAESALAAIKPDINVILLDIYLPGLSGLEALPKIKQLSPATQVVVLSASEKAKDGASAIQAGAFDYLSKPVDKQILVDTVKRAFQMNASLSTNTFKVHSAG